MQVTFTEARSRDELAIVRRLFEEYAERLGVDLCFQDFSSELKQLDTMYGPPAGSLILAALGSTPIGCVGLRRLSQATCEMKRLYVRDEARGQGIGRQLAVMLIERARELGYARMVLDTLGGMTAARTLYASLGFRECAPYYHNPLDGVIFMVLALADPTGASASARGADGRRTASSDRERKA